MQHHGKAQMKLFKILSIVIVPIGLAACGSVSKLTQDGTSPNRDIAEISPESWSPIPTCVRLKLAKQDESVKFIDSDYRESLSAHLIAKG